MKRDVVGRKTKKLRLEGMIPATVYGNNVPSVSVTVTLADFKKVYAEAGETGLVELSVDGSVRPTLIHHVQKDPLKDTVLHVEFHQVDLKVNVKAAVPLAFIGESPAVAQKIGVLLTLLTEIEVEALPTDLPEKIEVDVSTLTEVDQEVKVSDLKVPSGVTVLSDATVSVVKVGSLVSKEAEAQAEQEAAAAEAAAPVAEGAAATPEEEVKTEGSAEKKEAAPKE